MATFTYEAIDSMGKTLRNKLDADNEQAVLAKLHEQKFHVVNIALAKGGNRAAVSGSVGVKGKVKLVSLVVFARQFSTMINAGISIVKCLDILESQTKDVALKRC